MVVGSAAFAVLMCVFNQLLNLLAGGTAFVTTQAISWSIFAATVMMMVVMIQQLVAGVAHCFRCWAIGAGACMMTAQAVSRVSTWDQVMHNKTIYCFCFRF